MKIIVILLFLALFNFTACTKKSTQTNNTELLSDTLSNNNLSKIVNPETITIEKNLLYDKYTLEDTYSYKKTNRQFQWHKIRVRLALLDHIGQNQGSWATLQNYKNKNGEAPLVKVYKRDDYKRISDTLGVERYQSVPLYQLSDSITPEVYGKDGSLVKLKRHFSNTFDEIETIDMKGKWIVPKKYIKKIKDSVIFNKAIFVDLTNQNILTIEKNATKWLVRSMNPATTGLHKPPHMQETPKGIFVIQEKKPRMFYLVDGTQDIGGFAPHASRFSNGGYIHGIPVNAPNTNLIEYSSTLGTKPRSHMCIRNATSHAKFVYDWSKTEQTIVFIFD